jgi:hypothetical protein
MQEEGGKKMPLSAATIAVFTRGEGERQYFDKLALCGFRDRREKWRRGENGCRLRLCQSL